ncbi:MAG: GlsB/YeaQ/YmgE family stress response membrane protein [Solirubrobacteraceae bacterium]
MGLLAFLIILFVMGIVVGLVARLLVPGPDPMGIFMTAGIGLAGTFIAGLFSWYVLHRHGAGLILSLAFSMLLVWLYRRSRGGYSRPR